MWTNTKAIAHGYACAVVVLLIGIAVRMILPPELREPSDPYEYKAKK